LCVRVRACVRVRVRACARAPMCKHEINIPFLRQKETTDLGFTFCFLTEFLLQRDVLKH